MSILYEGNEVELVCDGAECNQVFSPVYDKEDLDVLLSDSRDKGWRKHKSADGKRFVDSCPRCVKAWLRGGAKPSAGSADGQGSLL